MEKSLPLAGRNIILTGASKGLGRHIAAALWASGASLLITARDGAKLAGLRDELQPTAAPGQEVHVCAVDLGAADAPATVVAAARGAWKKLDGLINNAAVLGPVGKVWENDWSEWEQAIQVDLLAPVALCRLCVPWMISGGGGKIVCLSGGGATGPRPNFAPYAISKVGIVRFCEILADELKGSRVDVNSIAPGMMYTDLVKAVIALGPSKAGAKEYDQALKQRDASANAQALAAELCVFLSSSASDGITGKLISAQWDPWKDLQKHRGDLDSSDIYTLRRIVPKDRGKPWGDA